MRPLVSVVVPAYNAEPWIRRALVSIFEQSYDRLEVVVVDDGSSDATPDVVQSLCPDIMLVRQGNHGVSGARNAGAIRSSGTYVAFLDADDYWLPSKIEKQLAVLRSEPDLGLVHTGAVEVDLAGGVLNTFLDGAEGDSALDLILYKRSVICGGSSILMDASVFSDVGGYCEDLSTSADLDFHLRVAERHPLGFVPEVLVHYVRHGSNMHLNVERSAHDMVMVLRRALVRRPDLYSDVGPQARATVHRILAGEHIQAGQIRAAVHHGVLALKSDIGCAGPLLRGLMRSVRA